MNIQHGIAFRSRTARALLFFIALIGASLFAIPARSAEVITGTVGAAATPPDYIIGAEDVLEISIWKNADLSKTVTVRPDGKISLPLIGDVQAAGFTPNQLRDAIVSKLKKYQDTVVASVIVTDVKSYRVYVIGEVRQPGPYLLKSKTTVLQALSMAGGFTQFASKNKIVLVRKNQATGEEEKIKVSFDDLVYSAKPDEDMTLRPGDTIFVP